MTILVSCPANSCDNLLVFFAVGCVRHPGLDPGSSSRGARPRATAGRPYKSSRLADDKKSYATYRRNLRDTTLAVGVHIPVP